VAALWLERGKCGCNPRGRNGTGKQETGHQAEKGQTQIRYQAGMGQSNNICLFADVFKINRIFADGNGKREVIVPSLDCEFHLLTTKEK